jgi:hypothetical protein
VAIVIIFLPGEPGRQTLNNPGPVRRGQTTATIPRIKVVIAMPLPDFGVDAGSFGSLAGTGLDMWILLRSPAMLTEGEARPRQELEIVMSISHRSVAHAMSP